ncbi:MAG TPA: YbhB/YbcL family Raf kinase inhibitor-like protein [Candidatus Nanoarchaeia archaeon]|nr:YbhB/YbcL family Raf kinase inhibitor-like protein [Candidatus Nanoarchaeia archaeon]
MRLSSPAFAHGGKIPGRHTCDGQNISPPLDISDVPHGTKSLVLLMDDPDVPKHIRADGMWDHWIVFNMPPDIKRIPEGMSPEGERGENTSSGLGYTGPCPPDREHRYFFRLYALDCMLELEEGVSKAEVQAALQGHVLAAAELMGRYQRKEG